ncbi:hypothetical protein GCM10017562_30280 [Streptomyces roseofulvus]
MTGRASAAAQATAIEEASEARMARSWAAPGRGARRETEGASGRPEDPVTGTAQGGAPARVPCAA